MGILGRNQDQGQEMESPTEATEQRRDYLSYLLRLWQESAGEGIWRASLEDPHTGERTGFASLEDLFAFLQQRIEVKEQR